MSYQKRLEKAFKARKTLAEVHGSENRWIVMCNGDSFGPMTLPEAEKLQQEHTQAGYASIICLEMDEKLPT